MNTWRGFVVMVVSAVVGFAAMFGWLVLHATRLLGQTWPTSAFLELLGVLLAGIFTSGRLAARLLIGRIAGEEVAASGRWRLVPLHFVTGLVLVGSRFVAGGGGRWTWDHVASMALGLALIGWAVQEAWVYWIAPRRRRAVEVDGVEVQPAD